MSKLDTLIQLIGTETCFYCSLLTECLSLPDDGEEPRVACLKCINDAFLSYWLPTLGKTRLRPDEIFVK